MNFSFAPIPRLRFGAGARRDLPGLIARNGRRALLVTGRRSFAPVDLDFAGAGVTVERLVVGGEPSPELVDRAAAAHRDKVDVVVAVGGGSAIDAGKAISAMLPQKNSVLDHLEGLPGSRPHPGTKIPFIAVPTTAGTGAEATKNAVLSHIGPDGYKRSLRHENLIPDFALIDPELALSCPPSVTAACGMDALSQLIEAYLSPAASPLTDALAIDGVTMMENSLLAAATDRGDDLEARSELAYAAFLSGVCLANAGLGVIHGLAGSLGGHFPIPHGVACGTLLAASLDTMIAAMRDRDPENDGLIKCAHLGRLLCHPEAVARAGGDAASALVAELMRWTETLQLPRLGAFGIVEKDLDPLVKECGQKQNPIKLTDDELRTILVRRL